MILGYILRHGSTDLSPQPEWQSQIPLNALGEAQAVVAGEWIKQKIKEKKLPTWGVSSDLQRAIQTLSIASKSLNLEIVKPVFDLRAIDKDEDQEAFEARNKKAFTAIFASRKVSGRIPLISCHRSNTAFIGKFYGNVLQNLDYREASLIVEGGILEVSTEHGVMPLFGALDENPRANMNPEDGTPIAGFVSEESNHMPRKCGHCKWFDEDHCEHRTVTADDLVGIMFGRKRNAKGKWIVEKTDCCNSYQHKFVPSSPTVSSSGAQARVEQGAE